MSLKHAEVVKLLTSHAGLQVVEVRLDEAKAYTVAYHYTAFGSPVVPGQKVLVNTTGIDLDLGTGGAAFVVPALEAQDTQSYGHIIKLRYTPLQLAVDSVEEQASPYHEQLRDAESIEGMPVVCAELHSQMPLIAAAIKHEAPCAAVVYIMHDVAALPLALSTLAEKARETGLITHTISSGQAFGGAYEAVNLYSALLAAHLVCKADVAIVAPGPGVVGTHTAFGHSAVAQGEALNATCALEGKPIAALRLSWHDGRKRHEALSHHSKTVLSRVCLAPVCAPLPGNLEPNKHEQLEQQLAALKSTARVQHSFPVVGAAYDAIDLRGVGVRTMGRARHEDPEFFSAAFAAGIQAARMLSEVR